MASLGLSAVAELLVSNLAGFGIAGAGYCRAKQISNQRTDTNRTKQLNTVLIVTVSESVP